MVGDGSITVELAEQLLAALSGKPGAGADSCARAPSV